MTNGIQLSHIFPIRRSRFKYYETRPLGTAMQELSGVTPARKVT